MPEMLSTKRKFEGKTYFFLSSHSLKRFAQKTAKGAKAKGNLARITKEGKKWYVWIRGKV